MIKRSILSTKIDGSQTHIPESFYETLNKRELVDNFGSNELFAKWPKKLQLWCKCLPGMDAFIIIIQQNFSKANCN